MESEEMAKQIDTCYKNILEKFNPGARQLINAGKSYLKALHGAAAAAKIYLESLSRVAKQAQQGTCGGTADIGIALQQMIDTQREIQAQQLNTLKAFYVDLLVPLETNLEKDIKIVLNDHKKFNQQYRMHYEVYSKAATQAKKHSKKSAVKSNRTSASYDKEIKHLQTMEEEKSKLDAFCEISLKNAVVQERKRYGFVLERHTSLTKHWLAHYGKASALLEKYLDGWQETAKARDSLPDCVEFLLGNQSERVDDNIYTLPRTPELAVEDSLDGVSVATQLRKSHSVDTSVMDEDIVSLHEAFNPRMVSAHILPQSGTRLSKARSEFNIAAASAAQSTLRPDKSGTDCLKSDPTSCKRAAKGIVQAVYAYLSSGEHQLSFLEGDLIVLLGEKSKGWHYGENSRTGKRGWFPVAYTEPANFADGESGSSINGHQVGSSSAIVSENVDSSTLSNTSELVEPSVALRSTLKKSPFASRPMSLVSEHLIFTKMPGLSKLRKSRSAFSEHLLCPAPVPTVPPSTTLDTASSSATTTQPLNDTPTKKAPLPPPRLSLLPTTREECPTNVSSFSMNSADISLRSSSDSGFVNGTPTCPPPQPEIDYSDDDASKFPRLRNWLLYKSAQDLRRDVISQEDFLPTTMTLDRPKQRKSNQKLVQEPPVVQYLVTLTRTKNFSNNFAAQPDVKNDNDSCHRTSQTRKSRRFFLRNKAAIPSKSKSTTGKIKAAIFRSRSKDSVSADSLELSTDLWQHKPLVPVYVGWRPPMPLPSDSMPSETKKTEPLVERTCQAKGDGPRASLVMKRKFSSEPDLLEVDSDYSVPDSFSMLPMLPSLPPTLPFLTPVLARSEQSGAARLQRSLEHRASAKKKAEFFRHCQQKLLTRGENDLKAESLHSCSIFPGQQAHTLPRHKGYAETAIPCQNSATSSLHVTFSLDDTAVPKESERTETVDANGKKLPFLDYGYRMQSRLLLPEGGSALDQRSETTGNLCGPWYDLWGKDNSVKLCDIAQV